jgi:hypothetical protein
MRHLATKTVDYGTGYAAQRLSHAAGIHQYSAAGQP